MKYTYIDLLEDLELGEEIEFYYEGERYSISTNEKGWYLNKYGDDMYQSFKDVQELINNARINSMTLKDLWEQVSL